MKIERSALLEQFEACEVDPSAFGHREHIKVAYEMLNSCGFIDATAKYARAIQTIATNAGAPEKFNVTITLAFLSLIAERLHATKSSNFDEFLKTNEDLLSKAVLDRWYSAEQLNSEFARTHYLLPDRAA